MNRIKLLLFILLLATGTQVFSQVAYTGMRDTLTAQEIVAEMAPGINLYNTLEAICTWCTDNKNGLNSQTVWGNPITTPEMVQAMAERGFNTLRIPVTWYNHMGTAPDYKIDVAWMDRVEEVVNYAMDVNMYVILNIHHDDYHEERTGSWLCPTYEKEEQNTDQLEKVWTQIATRFKDYGDYLIFETMNEPREVGSPKEWSGGTQEHREMINAYNLAAVNAIRATGGNNATRFIMTPQVGANTVSALESLEIPNNDERIIASTHAYHPFSFCLDGEGTANWGSNSEVAELENMLTELGEHFKEKGQAIIMGEWGAIDKSNYAARVNYYRIYTNACKAAGITPTVWIYGLNREQQKWEKPMLEDAILQAYNPDKIALDKLILNIPDTIGWKDTIQATLTMIPETPTYSDVLYNSSDNKVAFINGLGRIIAKSVGSTYITITTAEKQIKKKLYVVDRTPKTNFKIEAEDYDDKSNVRQESCSDEGSGSNLTYIRNGAWSSYKISIDSTGFYQLTTRVATGANGGEIEVEINNNIVDTIYVSGNYSDDWQDWYTTDPVGIELKEKNNNIKLNYNGGTGFLFNINWIQLQYIGLVDTTTVTIRTTGLNLDSDSISIRAGESATISAEILPSDATNQEIFWTSKDSTIATVNNNGEVTGVKAGETIIVAETQDGGFKAECIVEVYGFPVSSGSLKNPTFTVFPNPVTENLTVQYSLNTQSYVDIKIMDISGRVVETLESNQYKPSGEHQLTWETENYKNGIYFLKCIINNKSTIKKIIVNR